MKYIKTHNCGTGKPIPLEVVRAMMVIRLNSFAKSMSGIKWDTCLLMMDMLNRGIVPWVLEEGSVGASGDLVSLAMIGATMIGLEEAKAFCVEDAYYQWDEETRTRFQQLVCDAHFADLDLDGLQEERLSKISFAAAETAFKKTLNEKAFAKWQTFELGAKEAMGLTNGSNFITAWATFAVREAELILHNASIATALSLEAIRGEPMAYSPIIHEQSNRHKGQIHTARQIRALIEGSQRMSRAAQKDSMGGERKASERVQDRYSFRCAPQVHGAAYEAWGKNEGYRYDGNKLDDG